MKLSTGLLEELPEAPPARSWGGVLGQLKRDWIVVILGPAVMLPISISYCALICHSPFAVGFFPVVLVQVMWSQFIGSAMFHLTTQFRTSCNMDPVASILFVQLARKIHKEHKQFPERILPCLIYGMAFASAVSGVFLFVMGRFRFGFMLRFLPYTVIAGFLAGIGILIMMESFSLCAGVELQVLIYRTVVSFFPHVPPHKWEVDDLSAGWVQVVLTTAYCAVAMCARRVNEFGTVLVLLAAVAAVVVVQSITGHSQPPKTWFIHVDGSLDWKQPFVNLAGGLLEFNPLDDWYIEFVLSYTFITSVSWCLSIAAIGKIAPLRRGVTNADEQDEIRNLGMVNMVAGVLGGHAVCHSFKIPVAMAQVGGGDLWPTITIGVNLLIFILSPRIVVDHVPLFVFSGIVLNLGLDFIYEWLVQAKKRIAFREWGVLLVTALVTARNITLAIFLGITLALVLFAFEYSALTGVMRQGSLCSTRSTVDRSPFVCRRLQEHGHHFKILWLQGYLFFGSVSHVADEVRRTVAAGDVMAVILDFALVPGMDASGVYAMIDLAEELTPKLMLTGLVRRLEKALRNAQAHRGESSKHAVLFHHLDDALEWCEEDILQRLSRQGVRSPDSEHPKPVVRVGSRGDVLEIAGMPAQATAIAFKRIWTQLVRKELQRFDRAGKTIPALVSIAAARKVSRGAVLYRAGETATELIVLSSGSLDVTRSVEDDASGSYEPHLPRHHLNTEKGDRFVFEEQPRPRRILRARPGAVLGMVEFARAGSSEDSEDSGDDLPVYTSTVTAVEESEVFAIAYADLTRLENANNLFAVILRTFLARLAANALGQNGSSTRQPMQPGLVSPVIKGLMRPPDEARLHSLAFARQRTA